MKSLKKLTVYLSIAAAVLFIQANPLSAESTKKPFEVTFLSTPMGSAGYNLATAMEIIFSKNSWVKIKNQETPGGMYIIGYMKKARKAIAAGKKIKCLRLAVFQLRHIL
ncbi:MAG: hypothetical protein HN580_26220 [Deltaproteobacteria bacterium]|jgi:hypothetical protein|nr:hypothetical protein [Deltaproteobacteria bacterium]MBT4090616.1 hypothetical protein [Deltaproteobacteria bacterium]MBT4264351.1 hypothetical protein [Deltaproteobacteria bacterium]MBT4642488.1 hypothetical protein [Deltaproteobacteria bacterium]MBT6498454.1 hypothetical protein [Deltaproteobacteria bacterium]